jgi:hypothetical protein
MNQTPASTFTIGQTGTMQIFDGSILYGVTVEDVTDTHVRISQKYSTGRVFRSIHRNNVREWTTE